MLLPSLRSFFLSINQHSHTEKKQSENRTSCLSSEMMSLPSQVESTLEEIYSKHNLPPMINDETRRRLSLISEELALVTLKKVLDSRQPVKTLDGFIKCLLNKANNPSPCSSSKYPNRVPPAPLKIESHINEGSLHSPQLLALGELEFNKAFLLLSYIPGKSLTEVISAEEIRQWKDWPMLSYEAAVWDRLGRLYCPQTDRRVSLEWDSGKTRYYQCHVDVDGSYTFKGPLLENTSTHLHKVMGDENVLSVKFADVHKTSSIGPSGRDSMYKRIAKDGIMIGFRCYHFFVFKDGGKEEKKKDVSTNGVICYFIHKDSTALINMGHPYISSGKSIHEARMHFMHVHTLPNLASYMARLSLILSKTRKLDVDMAEIILEIIDDIQCHDQDNDVVLDKNGKPRIHSDGTGYISKDLARMCPTYISKGQRIRSDNMHPLLIQFRMFKDGYAVKGTFLLNKKLPPRTVQVRPSMIKVGKDENLSNFTTFNSLEVVNTSNPPKRTTKLSRNLIALLSYGGVPDDFFLNILNNTWEESKAIFYDKRTAHRVAVNHGDMDDWIAAEMISVGIPLEEPHLKKYLTTLLKTERKDLKAGKLPVTESYYLMGTVDPTGELKEDEVCVILEPGQISGDVLVYRNPGLHFGDIHILKATYIKALEEYVGNSKYAVFFPQKGPRSLGDEIAGGDFDGDPYFISRNPELLENFKPSEPWVSLSPPSKSSSARKPNEYSLEELEEQLFEMFLKTRFNTSNVIGIAADSWLTIMDRFLTLGDERAEEKTEMKKKMTELIDIYYDALDAPKKGAKVYLPNRLKPDIFPHYMKRDKTFKSKSILGLIYDFVKSETTEKPTPSSDISKLQCFMEEPVSESHMESCRQWYDKYRAEMTRAMNTAGSDKNEVTERYKQEFYGAAGFDDSEKSLKELYQQALALYRVVYDYAAEKGVSKCRFVWKVAGPVLCRFFAKKNLGRCIASSPSALKEIWG